jgi:hypothetical protein
MSGLRQFGERASAQAADLAQTIEHEHPDVLFIDEGAWGAAAEAERSGLPWAYSLVSALPLTSRDAPPFGLRAATATRPHRPPARPHRPPADARIAGAHRRQTAQRPARRARRAAIHHDRRLLPRRLADHLLHRGALRVPTHLVIAAEGLVALVVPVLAGAWSDQLRTKIGGRLPFLAAGAPVVGVTIALLGFMQSLGLLALLVVVFFIAYYLAYEPYRALYPDLRSAEVAGRGCGATRRIAGSPTRTRRSSRKRAPRTRGTEAWATRRTAARRRSVPWPWRTRGTPPGCSALRGV